MKQKLLVQKLIFSSLWLHTRLACHYILSFWGNVFPGFVYSPLRTPILLWCFQMSRTSVKLILTKSIAARLPPPPPPKKSEHSNSHDAAQRWRRTTGGIYVQDSETFDPRHWAACQVSTIPFRQLLLQTWIMNRFRALRVGEEEECLQHSTRNGKEFETGQWRVYRQL